MPDYKRLAEAIDDYEQHRLAKGKATSTVVNEMYVLRRFLAWYTDVQMRHMTPEKVSRWFYGEGGLRAEHTTRDGRRRDPVAASTHNYYRTRLNGFFAFASRRGWLKADLLEDVDPLRLPTRLRQRPTAHVLRQMVEAAGCDRDRALLTTLIHTGLRMNEVMRLRIRDVDLETGSLFVYISKSDMEDAQPITAPLARELRRWMLSYSSDMARVLADEDFLFPARRPGQYKWVAREDGSKQRLRTADTWRTDKAMAHAERVVKAALESVGLPSRGEGCHTLRRAAARAFFDDLAEQGRYDSALRIVSAWLHHKNSTTTERYLGLAVERKMRDEYLRGREFLGAATEDAMVLSFPAQTS